MAIEEGQETLIVTTTERTWRTIIETPDRQDPSVEAFRETVRKTADGTVISRDKESVRVERSLSAAVANNDQVTVTFKGKEYVIPAVVMGMAIPAFIDLWRTQDKQRAADRDAAAAADRAAIAAAEAEAAAAEGVPTNG